MKKKNVLLIFVSMLAISSILFSCKSNSIYNMSNNQKISFDAKCIAVSSDYHDVILDAETKDFFDAGFSVGDMVKLSFNDDDNNEYELLVPVCDYYNQVNRGDEFIATREKNLKIAMFDNTGEGFTDRYNVSNHNIVYHIELETKAGYDADKYILDTFDFQDTMYHNGPDKIFKNHKNYFVNYKFPAINDNIECYFLPECNIAKNGDSILYSDEYRTYLVENDIKVKENIHKMANINYFLYSTQDGEEVISKELINDIFKIVTKSKMGSKLPKYYVSTISELLNDEYLYTKDVYYFSKDSRKMLDREHYVCKNENEEILLFTSSEVQYDVELPEYVSKVFDIKNDKAKELLYGDADITDRLDMEGTKTYVESKYADVYLNILTTDMKNKGYEYGDIVEVTFNDKSIYMPIISDSCEISNGHDFLLMNDTTISLCTKDANFSEIYNIHEDTKDFKISLISKKGYDADKYVLDNFDLETALLECTGRKLDTFGKRNVLYTILSKSDKAKNRIHFSNKQYTISDFGDIKAYKSINKIYLVKKGKKIYEEHLTLEDGEDFDQIYYFDQGKGEYIKESKIEDDSIVITTETDDIFTEEIINKNKESYVKDFTGFTYTDGIRLKYVYYFDKRTKDIKSIEKYIVSPNGEEELFTICGELQYDVEEPAFVKEVLKLRTDNVYKGNIDELINATVSETIKAKNEEVTKENNTSTISETQKIEKEASKSEIY